tara:strand:- start:676 stop:822 length:147 start_codon:yes stop_codon:yes gene_type:complete
MKSLTMPSQDWPKTRKFKKSKKSAQFFFAISITILDKFLLIYYRVILD